MNIYIGSDHGGFALKKEIIEYLHSKEDIKFFDMGPFEFNSEDDYPDFAEPVAQKVATTPNSLGILICKSGNGMVIAANKVKGAYAALCFSKEHASKAREHDNANVLCLDSEYEGEEPLKILESFLQANFDGQDTRHGRRFKKIQEIEENN